MKVKRLIPTLCLIGLWTVSTVALAQPKSPGDEDFARKAAVGGKTEIEASKLALQKSSDERVRKFAEQMVRDHTRAGEDLKAAASQEGISLPAELDSAHKQAVDKLKALSGAQFDAAYKAQMLQDHKDTVAMFEKEAKAGGTPIETFASKTLPTLKNHLKMAQDLAGSEAPAHHH